MTLITCEGLGKSYGTHDVIKNLGFQIGPEDRIGLVGTNGCGKTTLLRILAGDDQPTFGTVQYKKGLKVGYLPQDPPPVKPGLTLWDSMQEVFGDLHRMEAQVHELSDQVAAHPDDAALLERLGDLQHEFEARDGYSIANRIETILTGLELGEEHFHKPLAHLSGGQRTRALLGKLLLEDPEILLLDEPTNHLDLGALEWLEKFLQGFRRCLVVVSHDRYFLDEVAKSIWELSFARLETFPGNYTAYTQNRLVRQTERMRQWEQQRGHIEKTEEYIRRFLAGQRSSQAKGRRTRLARFMQDEAIERPREQEQIDVQLKPAARSGDLIFRTTDLVAGYEPGKPLVRAGNLEVRRLQRIAIIGPNGTGKTTVLRTLMEQVAPLSGTVKQGASMLVGYLSQTHADLRPEHTVIDSLLEVADMKAEQARGFLGSFLFTGDDAFKKISELSGGQRSRVVLARLTAQGANVLMLDEPTNHLDLVSRDVLQQVLLNFEGTVLFVSHDRYLVQALATDLWVVQDGQLYEIPGNWEAYGKWRAARDSKAAKAASAQRDAAAPPSRRSTSNTAHKGGGQHPGSSGRAATLTTSNKHDQARQQKRTQERLAKQQAQLEEKIRKIETQLREMTDQITQASTKGQVDQVRQLGLDYEKLNAELQSHWDQWTKIGEQLEQPAAG